MNGATTPAESFTYDANGNRSDGTYDVQDRQLTQGTFAFTYTNNGERATKRDTTNGSQTNYYYDTTGNLLRVQRPAPALEVEYVIDGANRRVAKKLGATLKQGFLYAGSSIIAELDESGVVQSRFIYLGESHSPDLMVRGGVTYRFVKDVLGSPRLIVNAQSGMVAQRMDFDAWGNVVVDTAPGFQPFGFAGGLWDRDTGLVRFGARDYDPSSGRWMSKDGSAFGGGLNFYRYANADPVNYLDIDGHHPAVVALVIIAFVITYGTLLASDDAQIQAKVHPEAHNNPGAGLLLSVGMFPPVGALCGGGSTASRFVAAGESFSSDEAVIVRSIDPTKGEKIKDLLAEARQLHDETGLEHAIVSTHHGERYLVYGGESGISFNNLDVRRIIFHTHPMGYPNPSQADFAFLETLGQRSSWVLENKPIRFGVGP